jgi:hypothetical protein
LFFHDSLKENIKTAFDEKRAKISNHTFFPPSLDNSFFSCYNIFRNNEELFFANAKNQTVDKTSGFRQSDESFRPPFSKGGAVEGAQPSSRSAEREILLRRFFLRTQTREAICGELASLFSFAPAVSKKKWRMGFVCCYKLYTFGLQSPQARASFKARTRLRFLACGFLFFAAASKFPLA